MIKIPLHVLTHNAANFEGVEPVTFLEMPDTDIMRFPAEVKYALRAQLVDGGVLVEGRVETSIVAQCGRCLIEFERPIVNAEICHFYETPSKDMLDVTDDIREDIVLAIPYNPLCDDECKGLCPDCGVNLNEKDCGCQEKRRNDSLWKDLDDLKFEK